MASTRADHYLIKVLQYINSVSTVLLSTGVVSFIGQVLVSATCFVFLRAVLPILSSGLSWDFPVILDELRCDLVSKGT